MMEHVFPDPQFCSRFPRGAAAGNPVPRPCIGARNDLISDPGGTSAEPSIVLAATAGGRCWCAICRVLREQE